MKKVLSFVVIATMLMATLLTATYAAPDSLNIGLVKVLYAGADTITVDGTINASEWDETNSLKLKCGTNMQTWSTDYPGEIQFFYSWGDDGLYMAAKVIDSTLTFTTTNDAGEDTIAMQDRFQIAFNPCGLMYDDASGLFFSFYPTYPEGTDPATITSGTVGARKHNWEENTDNQTNITEAGYKGAYTITEDGWDMEVVLPWNLISSKDRIWDIIDYETEGNFCSVLDPKNDDRTKAFTEAIIAYVDMESVDGVTNTGRTVTEASKANEWSVGTYDIVLKFYMEGESTDDETVTYYTVDDLKAIFTEVDWSSYDKADETEAEGEDEGDETEAPSGAESDTAAADKDTAAGTNAADTTGTPGGSEGGNTGLIIGIVVAVVAVVAVAAVVIAKKKK